ncbi:MAG: hypothetical protein MJ164_02045 [Alphaproteobacteria bacterium]|nr:hypothetical protein [Alphaproteobacteria bacterium]
MKKYITSFCVFMLMGIVAANANWQYPVNGMRRGYGRVSGNGDDGMHFVLSVRGGAAFGRADIKNEIGGLTGVYMVNINNGEIVTKAWYDFQEPSEQANYIPAGYASLGDLPATDDYSEFAFAAGVSLGFTMPDAPQWRVELGFDHISESDYNGTPLFQGSLITSEGYVVDAQSGGMQSTLSSDIYSVMAFYDFFDGLQKPLKQMIPYVGIGAGYADTKTVLQLTDSYGDLSDVYELQNFGVVDSAGVIQFNKAETRSSNLAPILAAGFSYGLSEQMFLDVGARAMLLPKIKWQLTSEDNDLHRDWFSADKMMYLNAMIGLRVEF